MKLEEHERFLQHSSRSRAIARVLTADLVWLHWNLMQTKMQEKLLKKPVWYGYLKAINQISSNQCGQPAEQQQEKKNVLRLERHLLILMRVSVDFVFCTLQKKRKKKKKNCNFFGRSHRISLAKRFNERN